MDVNLAYLLRVCNLSQNSKLLNCQGQIQALDWFLKVHNRDDILCRIQWIIVVSEAVEESNFSLMENINNFAD